MFPHTHQPDISVFIPLFYLAYLLSTAGFCHHGSLLILYLYSTCMLSRFSHNKLFANLRTAARQSLLSMGFSRQEYWSKLPCLPPGDLPDPGIKPRSPALKADCLPSGPPSYDARFQFLLLPFPNSVTLDNLLQFSKAARYFNLKSQNNNNTNLTGLLWGVKNNLWKGVCSVPDTQEMFS